MRNTRVDALVIPKVNGCDVEVANFIVGQNGPANTAAEAARKLLHELVGIPGTPRRHQTRCGCDDCRANGDLGYDTQWSYASRASYSGSMWGPIDTLNPRDHGRTYLPQNGGCAYIDLNHVELCLPEVTSAHDHVACWHAMLRILREALDTANAGQPEGEKINVLINNSDGEGHSYGSHLNFLITETCWRNIFTRKMQYLLYLAAYQVSSIIFTGQGKVGSENGAAAVGFQLSQRADFFEQLTGPHTTYARPIVNSREEALCGDNSFVQRVSDTSDMARLHVIFYDSNLCHTAILLKVGVMQIILAMIEAEAIDPALILDDPIGALKKWSHDPGLRARAQLCGGVMTTAVDLQRRFRDAAARFAESGKCEGIVPNAAEIVRVWSETLDELAAHDLPALSRRLDWALKFSLLDRVRRDRRLEWEHPALKQLDHLYSSLDTGDGLYWALERDGAGDLVTRRGSIERFMHTPPDDTRAWGRAMLLRLAGADRVASIDWDRIRFDTSDSSYHTQHRTLDLASPLGFTRRSTESILEREVSLGAAIDALDHSHQTPGGGQQ